VNDRYAAEYLGYTMLYSNDMALNTESYKNKLTEALAHVTDELRALGIHTTKNPKDWVATPSPEAGPEPDPNDAADRVEEWDEHAATLAELERQYNDVTRALQKIEDGAYGVCEVGHEKIETDRLDANPAARTCKMHLGQEASVPQ